MTKNELHAKAHKSKKSEYAKLSPVESVSCFIINGSAIYRHNFENESKLISWKQAKRLLG